MTIINCASGTIAPFVPSPEKSWDKRKVLHLYRRLGFGANPQQVEAALSKTPEELVDELIDEAINLPLAAEPEWAYWTENNYQNYAEQADEQRIAWIKQWVKDMAQNGLREKLTLFWHNHFVTKLEAYQCTSHMYQYHKVLQENVLGNFKNFVYEIGKTPAMLVFLNGAQNTNIEPNENYARELYELFTLGRDNGYTQKDIQETARALTGWIGQFAFCGPIGFVKEYFDQEEKEIFGQKGNWGYDEVHDILFEQRADLIAEHICKKIYRHFVHPEVDEAIVAELAMTFKASNFEVAPVFRQLFKSEHFFDDKVVGTLFKSPIDVYLSFMHDGDFPYNDEILEAVTYFTYMLGQELFNPVDVAGWPGDRNWINNNTLTGRWQTLTFYLYFLFENHPDTYVKIAKSLSDNAKDPAFVTQAIIDHFIPNGLTSPEAYARATEVFKYEVPQNYFDNEAWNLDWEVVPAQVFFLLEHLIQLPEFQLQ